MKDINSVLEVTVYDEDKDHKVEFLGKVAIPLLRIQNCEKRWYALKDKKLRGRAKGNSPQILMEMYVVWNKVWIHPVVFSSSLHYSFQNAPSSASVVVAVSSIVLRRCTKNYTLDVLSIHKGIHEITYSRLCDCETDSSLYTNVESTRREVHAGGNEIQTANVRTKRHATEECCHVLHRIQ